MPGRVTICEMSLRDGMQVLNRSARIPLEMRRALLGLLQKANFEYIEVGSFVSEKAFPQFQDTAELFRGATPVEPRAQLAALVPNLKYYEQFRDTPNLTTVAMFLSASEEYSQQNKRMSIEEDLAESKRLAAEASKRRHRLRAHLSGAFRNLPPRTGPADLGLVTQMCGELITMGCETVALADTDGTASPQDIHRTINHLSSRVDLQRIGVHLHDRFGQAIANAWEAYWLGVRSFDSALGGIGGNKAVEQSVGNMATEELVHMFELTEIDTGINVDAMEKALKMVYEMTQLVGDPRPCSRVLDELLTQQST